MKKEDDRNIGRFTDPNAFDFDNIKKAKDKEKEEKDKKDKE